MGESEDAFAIVKAIIQLAKNLGLEVTAEGIETESQALALQALGCKRGQGFYLGRPSPGVNRLSDASNLGRGNKSSIKRIA
jgi:EAL domain-containing protein (putative c-di-GMP-specific phosphodiesterase class I)